MVVVSLSNWQRANKHKWKFSLMEGNLIPGLKDFPYAKCQNVRTHNKKMQEVHKEIIHCEQE